MSHTTEGANTMNNPVSRLDMVKAMLSYARGEIMPTSDAGENILRLALWHYYDDMSYNELDIRYSALLASSQYNHHATV
jgi:hypothetical protein